MRHVVAGSIWMTQPLLLGGNRVEDACNQTPSLPVCNRSGAAWTTKLKDGLTTAELKVGDLVHFDFVEKDGKKWITELRRTHSGGSDKD